MTSPAAEKLITAEEFALTKDPPGIRTEHTSDDAAFTAPGFTLAVSEIFA
jgi:hypothetical protein